MKFIHYIENVSGVSLMGLSSLLLFVVFFLVMVTWVLRSNGKQLDKISRIPLDE